MRQSCPSDRCETGLRYFLASSDLLMDGGGAVLVRSAPGCSDGIIADGCSAPSTIEPLFAIDVASVVIEPLGVVVDEDEDDDGAVLGTALVNRNGTSSVK
jgi:hypothetical protein